jgi:hypothetical protein
MPREGSPDHFHMASMGGLMERASRLSDLEGAFGCGEMPMRPHPAGQFETAFVRQSFMQGGPQPCGRLWGPGTGIGGAGQPGRAADPITPMELCGKIYLRVPNREGTEEPVFTPPDAIPMPYEKMIEIEKAEYDRRMKYYADLSPGC